MSNFETKQVSKEEYDIIKKIIIDGTELATIVITDGERQARLIVDDAYEM